MKVTEEKLSAGIKAGKIDRLYFIYGKEPLLINMYADNIVEKTVGKDADDFNLQRFGDLPDPDMLSEFVESIPVFADVKTVLVKDFDPEKADAELSKKYLNIISDIPDTTVLVFYSPSLIIEEKGMKAKTKKFIETAGKYGTVCAIEQMKPPKIAELCVRKAAKDGVVISQDDALYLTTRTGGHMFEASDEMNKLINYVGKGGQITRSEIELLVPKQLSAGVFELAGAVNAGKKNEAFRIIDELFLQQFDAVNIMSALSGTFLDMYCAKLAKTDGINASKAAQMFGFYGGKAWGFTEKVYPLASNLRIGYLRKAVSILSEADITLKSSPLNKQTVIEETVVKLFEAREKYR